MTMVDGRIGKLIPNERLVVGPALWAVLRASAKQRFLLGLPDLSCECSL